MGAEQMSLHVVNLRDSSHRANYVKTLTDDSEALSEACTAKSTMYCANVLSGLVAKTVKNILVDSEYCFNTEFNLKTDFHKSFKHTKGENV
jgi:hypothetical protein